MIKAVFFDFDMTLANTEKGALATYTAFCKFANLFPHKSALGEFTGSKVSENIKKFTSNKTEQKMLYNLFLKIFAYEIPSFEVYGKDLLLYLKKKKIKIIIISNNSKKAVKAACKYWKIPYDILVGDEDMRKEWEKHQEITFLRKKLKLKNSQVLYVGDHIHDIEEAKKAKIHIASVTTGMFSRRELLRYHPDHIVNDLNKLIKII
jgi:phosphoglycolate phosphatase